MSLLEGKGVGEAANRINHVRLLALGTLSLTGSLTAQKSSSHPSHEIGIRPDTPA